MTVFKGLLTRPRTVNLTSWSPLAWGVPRRLPIQPAGYTVVFGTAGDLGDRCEPKPELEPADDVAIGGRRDDDACFSGRYDAVGGGVLDVGGVGREFVTAAVYEGGSSSVPGVLVLELPCDEGGLEVSTTTILRKCGSK